MEVNVPQASGHSEFVAEKDAIEITNIPVQSSELDKQELKQSKVKTVHQSLTYRPDIDGLRAIAVGIVVIFHAWPSFMTGGFIGVDIFFVISGYLISGIIIKQSFKNKFSFVDFYSRRVKRIYPALIVMLTCALLFGCKFLNEVSLQVMTKTMAAASVFGANIQVLTYERDYFDPEVKANPMLHLWSLGVEEQFYIVWPLLLSLVIKFWSKRTFSLMTIFTIGSFVLSIIVVFSSTKFAFYFPVCRFWQMAIGGLVAYRKLTIQNKLIVNGLSSVSTIAILLTVWIMDENSLFPGFWALIPTLGAVCILQAGMDSYLNANLLASKPFVFMGKISYPLYLWHWPLLVFSRYLYPSGSKSIFANTFFIVGLAILLSVLTYHFVENKIRYRKTTKVVILLVIGMALVGLSALIIYKNANFYNEKTSLQNQKEYEESMIPSPEDFYVKNGTKLANSSKRKDRQPPNVNKIKTSETYLISKKDKDKQKPSILEKKIDSSSKYYHTNQSLLNFYEVANEGKQNELFIIGDSHAQYLSYRFRQLYLQSLQKNGLDDFPTIVLMANEGLPLLSCETNYDFIMSRIKQHKPKRILFIYRWLNYWKYFHDCKHKHLTASDDDNLKFIDQDLYQLKNTIREIQKLGTQVFISTLSPQGKNYNPLLMLDVDGVIESNIQPISLMSFNSQNKVYIDRFQNAMKELGVGIVRFSDHLCWEDRCEVLSPTGYAIFRDDNHHSKLYSRYWASSVDFLIQFKSDPK